MKRNHTVSVLFIQDTVKQVKDKNGNMVDKPVKHSYKAKVETDEAITSDKLSDFIIAQLFAYQNLQALQGKRERFDTSLPVDMEIRVDDKVAASSIKFSTNPTTLKTRLEKYPTVVAMVFDPRQLGWGVSRQQILEYAQGKVAEILPAIEPEDNSLASQMPLVNADNIEEVEVVE